MIEYVSRALIMHGYFISSSAATLNTQQILAAVASHYLSILIHPWPSIFAIHVPN
jgi:hypothetical protein